MWGQAREESHLCAHPMGARSSHAEGKLEAAFRSEAARLVGSGAPAGQALRYVAFDFHKECGGMRYHRLSVLWDQVRRRGGGLD